MSVLVGGNCHILVSITILTRQFTHVYKHSSMGQPLLKSYKPTIFMNTEVTTTAHIAASYVHLQLQHTYLHQYTGPVYESESCIETTVSYNNIIQRNYTHQGTILYLLHPLPPSSVVSSFLSLFRHDGVHTIVNGYVPQDYRSEHYKELHIILV